MHDLYLILTPFDFIFRDQQSLDDDLYGLAETALGALLRLGLFGVEAERLEAVLTVSYLIFNEGYAATRSGPLVRTDLCAEAIRLGRLVRSLMSPPAAEATALLALMLLHDSRRDARLDPAGDVVTLDEQDRNLWHRDQIEEALPLAGEALRCRAARPEDTDWPRILLLYGLLERVEPSPVVSLNRAVAVAMVEGPARAVELLDALAAGGALDSYHLLHSARAEFLRRLGDSEGAAAAYRRALELVGNDSERRFLERRLRELRPGGAAVSGGSNLVESEVLLSGTEAS